MARQTGGGGGAGGWKPRHTDGADSAGTGDCCYGVVIVRWDAYCCL